MSETIRLATVDDAAEILAIYRPFIEETTVTLEYRVPSRDEFADRLAGILAAYPFLVHVSGSEVTGYAYATRQGEREGYKYNAAVSVYVKPGRHRAGIGRKLYSRLFPLLREQGVANAYGVITLPNAASVGLHRATGFVDVAVFHRNGYKLGRWVDILWMAKRLDDGGAPPPEIKPITALSADAVSRILAVR